MAPELLTIPGLGVPVTVYGAAVALALVLAWALSLSLARRDRLPTEAVGLVFVIGALIGLFAARVGYLVQASLPLDATSLRALPAGGLAVFPGLFVALPVMALACRRWRVPALAWLDCAAPAIALGGAIERVGAFFAGADFGRYVGPGDFGHALSVTYPPGSPAYVLHVSTLHGLPGVSEASSAPVHPVQIYLALTCALAGGLGLWLRGRRRFSGQVLLLVAAVFLLGRAVLF
ncbi:MAG TPA: prolipoprotein diacylglyceryl transferase family protein, partial [Nannocystis sp.]